jgi:metal-dependent HD superfamily phosphatase/phosphodiesterase
MKFTLEYVKKNSYVYEFIRQTDKYIDHLGYSDHGFRHVNIVADRSMSMAKKIGLSPKEIELAGIAGYCHDMGNYLGRTQHHYWGSMLFTQIFINDENCDPESLAVVNQAIADHDKNVNKLVSKVAAILVLADKSDVARDRIQIKIKDSKNIENIHTRVNWFVLDSDLRIYPERKVVKLVLKVDKSLSVIEYFEIFAERMSYCTTAAKFLGYRFQMKINDVNFS